MGNPSFRCRLKLIYASLSVPDENFCHGGGPTQFINQRGRAFLGSRYLHVKRPELCWVGGQSVPPLSPDPPFFASAGF